MNYLKSVLPLMILVFLPACDNNDAGNTQPPMTKRIETLLDVIDSKNGKPLEEVSLDTPVRLVLELINRSDETVTFQFSSGQQYDFEVRDSGNRVVWNWSQGQMFIQTFTTIELGPKEQIKFTPIWDQTDNQGQQVPAGTYTVTGLIPTIGPEIVDSASKKLIIRE